MAAATFATASASLTVPLPLSGSDVCAAEVIALMFFFSDS